MIDPADRVKCLIVEQHEPTLEALEFSLRAPDREVFTATTAAEAMNLSREHDFAFVLIDVQVPTLDGYQLAEMMRGAERSSATPIVFMAAAGPSDPPPVFRGFESAAVDVLLKPGAWQADTGFIYTHFSNDFPLPILDGMGNITNVLEAQVRRRLLFTPLAVRYGLMNNVQLFATLPAASCSTCGCRAWMACRPRMPSLRAASRCRSSFSPGTATSPNRCAP